MNEPKKPQIGIGVIILKQNKVLVGQRKNSHGEGCWSLPGGHLEFGETFEECARREVYEETNLEITNIRTGPYTNDFFKKEKLHYVTLFMLADWFSNEPKIKEKDKSGEWIWVDWDKIPKPHFLPLENLLKTGYSPFNLS